MVHELDLIFKSFLLLLLSRRIFYWYWIHGPKVKIIRCFSVIRFPVCIHLLFNINGSNP